MSRHKSKTKQSASRNMRLAEQIQKDLAILIQRELSASTVGLITLSAVELSADYAHAKVYFTVIGQEPEVAEQALNDKAGYLHSLLFKMLHIHTVPTLRFFHDDHLLRSIEMSRLIDQAIGIESPTDEDDSDAFDDTKIKG
ncbi:ribosome-binding factor A [Oligella ureolytica]|uniref:30S ribosome-binding factor RbfA n=1 Tax=Oligella ureolytica TaxID=90244 RepID=UPI000E0716FC|nr:30S ribosome-binding factor RbfA [Oligella ureolytica]SUA51018.1 ribosome-binding factor A [Oligella ureolytica]